MMRPWILFGILLASLGCQLVGLVMFAKGFFPYKAISTTFASLDQLPPLPSIPASDQILEGRDEHKLPLVGTVAPRFSKVVVMLVDALRSDFLFGNESEFKFMQSLIDSHKAIPFTALASAPTVTLPRLKALTTGTVPGFLDAILNIAESDQSSTLANQDNWVAQLARAPSIRSNAMQETKSAANAIENRKIGFFGDDTWIKLFPGLFSRTDGTSSFFAMDTVEVDNNVTRHVEPELARDDWDALIFHYLGLDHVGHSGGPKSALMGPKQAEMDKIAETIYKTLVAKDSALQASDLPTLFILCGDHGMNEVGNHGGSSRSEISTSFLFMSSSFDNSRYQSQIDAMVGNYRFTEDREEYQHYRSVNQVDLVPTLSLLLGLPIPKNNVGRFIPEVLLDYEEAEILRAYQLNAHQVAGVLKNMWPDFETESSVLLKDFKNPDIEEETSEEFKRDAQRCKNEGVQKQRLVCWYTLALAGHASVLERMRAMDRGVPNLEAETHRIGWEAKKTYDQFLDEASSMLSTALSKYDMPLLTNGSLMMAFAVGGLIFCAMQTSLPRDVMASCVEPRQSAYLFGKGPSLSRQKGTPGRSTSGSLTSIFGERIPKTKRSRKRDRNEINWIIARILSAVILILYLVTLFASSFVEEEHQFWYFFNMTWWAVLAFTSGRYLASSNSSARPPSEKHSKDETRHEKRLSSSATAAVYCLLQMVILRVLRGWNQTGQKYADQIDLRHYLNATWVGVSWILFWITMAIVVATMVFFTTSFHSPFSGGHRYHRNQQPAWKSGLISVLQALLTTSIVLAALWITVYKMDVESAYFGDEVMRRVHAFTGTLSSVGYPAVAAAEASSTQEVGMSGYAMARGCYATLGAIAVMSYGLKALSSSGSASSASDTVRSGPESMEPITEMYTGTLFVPSMLLGTATLLLILLSRRHNAPLFVFFGMQLYLYLKWISLIRQRDLDSEEQDGAEYDDSITYIDEDVQADEISSDSAIDKAHLNTMETRNTGVSSRSLRSLPGQNSIHSCSILLWTLSSFFLFGNSNSIASIDISNAYVGIQAYDIGLTGVLTFVSNWAGPIWWCLAAAVVMKWDLEIELVCAKQDRQIVLKEEEEQSWRTVSRWRREDKGTWNKKTKRRIQLYKRALAKSQEDSTKEGETVGKEASMSPEPNAHPLNLESTEQHAQDFATNQDEPANLEDEDTFYVYEEQDTSAAVIEDSVSPLPHSSVPCILTDPPGYRRHLMQTRILDHLIFSSLFFGIALYALSIAAIVLRHHLFIWTVFSPKVLYQFAWTVLFQLVVQVLAVGCGVWSIVMVL